MESTIVSEIPQAEEFSRKEEEKTAIISKLPKANGWLSSEDYPLYHHEGFWYYGSYIRGVIGIKELSGFDLSPRDIIISSTPKSGTTWLKALSFAIVKRNCFIDRPEDNPLLSKVPHELMPLLEVNIAQRHEPREPDLPLISTHLPYTFLPDSILASRCKIVYLWRDPKDAFVSRWHFAHKMRADKEATQPIPLEEAIDLFCRGISPFGPYWDHVLGYWKAHLDHPNRILFLKYEDLIDDPKLHVKRLAEFMQFPFTVDEERDGVVEGIVEMCSFESLSNLNKSGNFVSKKSFAITKDLFFRKGKVGDWKNYLTEEMAEKIDQITIEKFGNSGLAL